MTEIILRFVTDDSMVSRLIRTQAGICMPFSPSHVEALSRDGKAYVGQHFNGGCLARPIGYDADMPSRKEKLVALEVEHSQFEAFHDFIDAKVGQPYDWRAILSFAAPDLNIHLPDTAICSALMVLALRTHGCEYFAMPLVVPAHHISPRDLFLILSSHVKIDH